MDSMPHTLLTKLQNMNLDKTKGTDSSAQLSEVRSLGQRIFDKIKFMKAKLGVIIDLLKFYTPFGTLIDMIRKPTSLDKWNPFQYISPGFLSGSLTLPSPDKLSDKPVNTSRITKWATKSILQASKLADTQNNKALSLKIKQLERAIKTKDEENILNNVASLASKLADILIDAQDDTDNNLAGEHMVKLQNIATKTAKIKRLDRQIKDLTTPTKEVNITTIPKDRNEFLKIAIDNCIPMTRKSEQPSQKDVDDMKQSWLVNRSKLECDVFKMCYTLEYPVGTETWRKHKDIDAKVYDIHDNLPKLPPYSPIGEKEALALSVLDAIIKKQPMRIGGDDPLSRLVGEAAKQLPTAQQELLGMSDDELEAFTSSIGFEMDNDAMITPIFDWCDKTMKQTIENIGNAIIASLSKNNPSMELEDLKIMQSSLLSDAQINRGQLKKIAREMTQNMSALLDDMSAFIKQL